MHKRAKRPDTIGPTRSRRGRPAALPTVQYTVRGVPARVDKALRRMARQGRKSLNEVLRNAVIREAEGTGRPGPLYKDLDALAGSWVDVPGFEDVIHAQDRVDEAFWR